MDELAKKVKAELQRLKNGFAQAKENKTVAGWLPVVIHAGQIMLVFAGVFVVFVIVSLNKLMNQRFNNK